MSERIKKRDSNIELLRILLILGVIVLHYNGVAGGFDSVQKGSANEAVLHLLEAICICAVDAFIMISGYYLCKKESISARKPLELIVQVIIWSEALIIASNSVIALRGGDVSAVGVLMQIGKAIIPANWFVILYAVTYLLSPYINRLIAGLSDDQFRKMVVLLFVCFSIWACFSDLLVNLTGDGYYASLNTVSSGGSNGGYTIVNFVFLYVLGAFIRRGSIQLKVYQSATICCICVVALWVMDLLNNQKGWGVTVVYAYNNPVIIVYSAALLMLFRELQIGHIAWINKLAEANFTVFLLHTFFLMHANVPKYVRANVLMMLAHILLTACVIYLICFIAYQTYKATIGSAFTKLWNHGDKAERVGQ